MPERRDLNLPTGTLEYLGQRVREEALAAANATSPKVTMVHVALATAYARCFGATCATEQQAAKAWVDEHRVW